MRKYFLTLNCTQAETEYRLKQELRVFPPKGIVEENHFKIYKHTPGVFHGNGLRESLYCFYGEYQQSGKKTRVSYRIRPGFTIFSFYLVLTLVALCMFYRVIFIDKEMITAVVSLGFLLLYTIIVQLGKKKCMIDFETQLTEKAHQKK